MNDDSKDAAAIAAMFAMPIYARHLVGLPDPDAAVASAWPPALEISQAKPSPRTCLDELRFEDIEMRTRWEILTKLSSMFLGPFALSRALLWG